MINELPKLTIVTVVYNAVDSIEKTILSVINQTYNNIEYIIIDGGSTDGTLIIIKKYIDKITKLVSEPDKGIYDAMNKGIKIASGDYIALLNAGDFYEENTCEIVARHIIETQRDIYHGLIKFYNAENKLLGITGTTIDFLNNSMINHPTCFVSKRIYDKQQYSLEYRSASDYDFICKAYFAGASFEFIPTVLCNFITNGMSSGLIGAIETYKVKYKYKFISSNVYYFNMIKFIFLKITRTKK